MVEAEQIKTESRRDKKLSKRQRTQD